MAVIAIALLCLGSVSASDDIGDGNMTAIDNSQDIVIDEVSQPDKISEANDNLAGETSDDVLESSETPELRDKDTGSMDVKVSPGTSVTIEANMEYDYWYLQMSTDGSSYSSVKTDTGHAYWYDLHTFTAESGTYYFKLVNYYGRYGSPSDVLKYTVVSTEETQTSISIDPTAVTPNSPINITPSVYKKGTTTPIEEGTVEFFYDDGTSMGVLDLSTGVNFVYSEGFSEEKTYNVYAVYQANEKYESSTSSVVPVLVSQDTSKTPVTVTVTLSDVGVAPGEKITITASVKNNNDEDVSGTVNIYDGNDNLIVSGLAIGSQYQYQVPETSGTYQIYAEYLGNEELGYAKSNSSKQNYKVKQQLKIDLTANDELEVNITPSSYGSVSVTFKANSEISPELELYLNGESFNTISQGSNTVTISFDKSDKGLNEIYVKFAGNDDYLEATSNVVKVNVYESVSVTPSITLNSTYVVEGEKILVTVTANNNAPGTITIYSDSSYSNKIATINVGESYEYTVGEGESTSSSYTAYVYARYDSYNDDENYVSYSHYAYASGSKSFTVLKKNSIALTGNDSTDSVEIMLGDSVTFSVDVKYWTQRSGYDSSYNTVYYSDVELYLDNEKFGEFEVTRTSEGYSYTYSISNFTIDFDDEGDLGEHTIYAFYKGYTQSYGASYESATSNVITVNVKSSVVKQDIKLDVTVDDEQDEDDYYSLDWGDAAFEVVTGASEDIDAEIIYKEGDNELGRAKVGEVFEIDPNDLGLGEHTITSIFEGNDDYNGVTYNFTLNVDIKIIWFTLEIDNVTYPDHAVGKFYSEVDGSYEIIINGESYKVVFEWIDFDEPVSFDINELPVGTYTVSSISFEDMEHYEFGISEIEGLNVLPTFTVNAEEVALDDTVLKVENGTSPVFSIDLSGAEGNLTVAVGDKNYTAELKDGKATVEITDLSAGNYTATVTYTGDDKHQATSVKSNFTVEKMAPEADSAFDVNIPSGSANPVFAINLPNATGNLTVTIGNNTYTKELVNGSASITVNDLAPGSYNATVFYSGDNNYASISKVAQFTVPTPKLSAKNLAVVYSSKGTYKVLVTVDGKAAVGEMVSIKFNGKTYQRTTDKNGYATLSLNTKVKVKSYEIIAEYKGVKVSNVVTIKHLIKAKNVKVKKSKKVSKIKVKTKKVNGKFLKGKKLKLKLKGKTLKAKINKKGVAKFKVKKKVLKKLKVGKKYKYTVSYGKDSVTKKVKVKR